MPAFPPSYFHHWTQFPGSGEAFFGQGNGEWEFVDISFDIPPVSDPTKFYYQNGLWNCFVEMQVPEWTATGGLHGGSSPGVLGWHVEHQPGYSVNTGHDWAQAAAFNGATCGFPYCPVDFPPDAQPYIIPGGSGGVVGSPYLTNSADSRDWRTFYDVLHDALPGNYSGLIVGDYSGLSRPVCDYDIYGGQFLQFANERLWGLGFSDRNTSSSIAGDLFSYYDGSAHYGDGPYRGAISPFYGGRVTIRLACATADARYTNVRGTPYESMSKVQSLLNMTQFVFACQVYAITVPSFIPPDPPYLYENIVHLSEAVTFSTIGNLAVSPTGGSDTGPPDPTTAAPGLASDVSPAGTKIRAYNVSEDDSTVMVGVAKDIPGSDWEDVAIKTQAGSLIKDIVSCIRWERAGRLPNVLLCLTGYDKLNGRAPDGVTIWISDDDGKTFNPLKQIFATGTHGTIYPGPHQVWYAYCVQSGAIKGVLTDKNGNILKASFTVVASGVDDDAITCWGYQEANGVLHILLQYRSSGAIQVVSSSDGVNFS